jgi:hypothetical protein
VNPLENAHVLIKMLLEAASFPCPDYDAMVLKVDTKFPAKCCGGKMYHKIILRKEII